MLEPKYFSNVSAYKLSFTDNKGNLIDIYPLNSGVQVSLSFGEASGLSFAIPSNFKEYQYSIDYDVALTNANVDSILSCTNVTHLTIIDARDLAKILLERIDDLAKMTELQTLKLTINKEYLENIKLSPFLEQLPSLRFVTFVFPDLHEREIEAFLRRQIIPMNWQRHGNYADSAIYHRRG